MYNTLAVLLSYVQRQLLSPYYYGKANCFSFATVDEADTHVHYFIPISTTSGYVIKFSLRFSPSPLFPFLPVPVLLPVSLSLLPVIPLRDVHGYKPGSEVDPFLPQSSVVVTVTALDDDNETIIESLTSKPRSVDYCRLVNQTVLFIRDTHKFGQWGFTSYI